MERIRSDGTESHEQIEYFTSEERAEVDLYQDQERFKRAAHLRQVRHRDMIVRLETEFAEQEELEVQNRQKLFEKDIKSLGIAETRIRTVPAYAFDRFEDLPKELQVLIWRLAILSEPYTMYTIMSMSAPFRMSAHPRPKREIQHPSCIFHPFKRDFNWNSKSAAQICRDAFSVYISLHAPFCQKNKGIDELWTNVEINTELQSFYMAEDEWSDFKILIDFMILRNTTRAYSGLRASAISSFRKIRHLMVDLNVFGGAPEDIWTEFHKLETLTIVFYPYATIRDGDRPQYDDYNYENLYVGELDPLRFLFFEKPHPKNRFGKRAALIHERVAASLSKVAAQSVVGWKMPRLEVKVRRTGRPILDFFAGQCERELAVSYEDFDRLLDTWPIGNADIHRIEQQILAENMDTDRVSYKDDSQYSNQLLARLSHPMVSRDQIKRWKQKFHPSYHFYDYTSERMLYFSDSEGDYDQERPYATDSSNAGND